MSWSVVAKGTCPDDNCPQALEGTGEHEGLIAVQGYVPTSPIPGIPAGEAVVMMTGADLELIAARYLNLA